MSGSVDGAVGATVHGSPNDIRRDVRLDALKGFVIVLVVLSHAIQDFPAPASYVPLRLLIFIDMPLFMMLAGYSLGYARPRSALEQVVHRVKTLLVPYVAWGLLAPVLYGEAPDLLMTLTGRAGPWFLLAVFVFEVALALLKRLTANPWALLGMSWLVTLGAYALSRLPALATFRVVEDMAHFFVFYVAGYVAFGSLQSVVGDRRKVAAAASAMLGVATVSLGAYFAADMLVASPWTEAMSVIATETARLSIGLSAGLIAAALIAAIPEQRLRIPAWIGTLSLGIYLIHIHLRHWASGSGWGTVALAFVAWTAISIVGTLVLQRLSLTRTLLLGGRAAKPARAAAGSG